MSWEAATGTILTGTLFFFVYLANSINGDSWFHRSIRQLLVVLSIWITVIGSNLAISFARANTAVQQVLANFQALHTLLVYSAWVFTALFVLYFIYEVLLFFQLKNKQEHDDILGK